MKTTYNGTYTQVDELQNAEGKITLRQKLKQNVLQDAFVRANFLSGARFLQTLKDPTLLTIDEVIENSEEVSIVCKNDGFQQLGVYLATQNQLSDVFLVELIKKMLACLDTLHKNSIFHQGLNPNSFIINTKGEVKLTLFGTLEHRLYHHMPSVGNENPSIQNAVRFYSPERKVNYGAINQESEFYSIGLIIWYLKCVQLNLANTQELVLNFPEYSNTGSVWDKVIEACLQEEPRKRPKSTKDIIGLLPVVASEPIKKIVIPTPPKKVTLSFFNYNSTEYEIKINGTGIENYNTNLEGSKLTIIANEGLEVHVFSKKTGTLITTFNSSKLWQYTLPKVEEEKQPPRPNPTNTSSKKNSPSTLYIIIGVLLLLVLILLFRQCGKNTDASVNASDNATENSPATSNNDTIKSKQKIETNIDSLKKVDSLKNIPKLPFPYTKEEIVNFIVSYYQMLNGNDANNFEYFFEPIIDQFFKVPNMTNIAAKENYNYHTLRKVSSSITYDLNKISINRDSEIATIILPIKIVTTNKIDNTIKNYDVMQYFIISKNLKIKSLTEIIQKKY